MQGGPPGLGPPRGLNGGGQVMEPPLPPNPLHQIAWPQPGCGASMNDGPSMVPEAFAGLLGQSFQGLDACSGGAGHAVHPLKLPLPFPTQSLPFQSQQQSSLAATFSRLSSQLYDAQLCSLPNGMLDAEEPCPAAGVDRDDYLMRLLRRGQLGGGGGATTAQQSSMLPNSSVLLPTLSEAAACTRGGGCGGALPCLPEPPAAGPAATQDRPPPATAAPSAPCPDGPPQQLAATTDKGGGGGPAAQAAAADALFDYAATQAALGEREAANVRATILRQQLTFIEQLYELHRVVAVQKLLMRRSGASSGRQPQQPQQQQQQRQQPRAAAPQPQRAAQAQRQQPPPPAVIPPGAPPLQQQQQPQGLPPHLQWSMGVGGGPGLSSGGGTTGDPMAWWYQVYYGGGIRLPPQQQQQLLPPQPGLNGLTSATAAAMAAVAAPILDNANTAQRQLQRPSASAAASAGMGDMGSTRPAATGGGKWWQDAAATFGPPGDPEVVAARRARQTRGGGGGACEVESAPPQSQGRSRKRKVESVEEASSETTGRDLGRSATGGGAECTTAFQRLPVRPRPTRVLPPASDSPPDSSPAVQARGGAVEAQHAEEHAAHMLLSFSKM